VTFDQPRADALRTAIIGTSQTLRHYPDGDAKTLLTEHLALLQEAELIFLTDAFVGDESHDVKSDAILRAEAELRATQAELAKATDPHAELRKTWVPGQRWQFSFKEGEWEDVASEPMWGRHTAYRRHPDDIDQPKPWYPDDSGEWVELPEIVVERAKLLQSISPLEKVEVMTRANREDRSWNSYVRQKSFWNFFSRNQGFFNIVAYKVVK